MYATVVIDIPDLNHKGFDYEIPEELLHSVKPGSRVIVPLGSRLTQGFVIRIQSVTDFKQVKKIKENLDMIPSLTEELIELGLWMSSQYSTHLFRVLQALIPSALKTRMEEYIIADPEKSGLILTEQEKMILNWVQLKQPVLESRLIAQFSEDQPIIQQMLQSGLLTLKKTFRDKGTKKKIKVVQLLIPPDQLLSVIAEMPKRAQKQREIMEFFLFKEINEITLEGLDSQIQWSRSALEALTSKGNIKIVEREQLRDPFQDRNFQDKVVALTDEQNLVFQQIVNAFEQQQTNRPFLLHGVTGSGKTEIYLMAIERILKDGKDSIVLVPEIALTPQMVERFKGRFGSLVAVLHSRLSKGERLDEWRRIQRGEAKIVVGARSAIFAPFKQIGLIIIDEEHESTYKQEEHPKYHSRDIAIRRANYHQAVVIFGSATPSLESYYKAVKKEYTLLELPNRVLGRSMPMIHVADMREELREGNRSMFSKLLQEMIEDRLNKKEQIVLLLNRRGHSTFVMCRNCGYVLKCPHCEISLTYHHSNQVMRCHYCGHDESVPKICPECGSHHIRYFGTGTQKVEEELAKRFPGIRVIRMDVDTTTAKGSHEKLLTAFKNHEADILLGTQMIAKGLDFPRVTLVGVIAADTLLKLPDFRSGEKTFQLLTQVSGRAGRHQLSGDVVIQTYTPEHYSIQFTSQHDYASFFKQELKQREMLNYPPIRSLILIHFSHESLPIVMKASERFVRELKKQISTETEVLGPVVSPISRLKDRYRFQCVIKYNDEADILDRIHLVMQQITDEIKDRNLQMNIDVDPYVLM